ncbi:MAG: hypothetical protein KJ607_00315, partial [Bacteroidetes bacterium]|nr:hypothetical protein [Bacteroidota bacterium]
QKNLESFVQQRKRWVSKSRFYRDTDILLTAVSVFMINLLLCFSFTAMYVGGQFWYVFNYVFIFKCAVDMALLFPYSAFAGKQNLIVYVFPLQMVYFWFSVVLGVAGNVTGFTWKGRSY